MDTSPEKNIYISFKLRKMFLTSHVITELHAIAKMSTVQPIDMT